MKSPHSKLEDHIHMLGCQAITEARNLGFAEGKGTKEDDGDLLEMIEKHEALLKKEIKKHCSKLIANAERRGRIDEWERMAKIYPTAPMIPDFIWKPRLDELKKEEKTTSKSRIERKK